MGGLRVGHCPGGQESSVRGEEQAVTEDRAECPGLRERGTQVLWAERGLRLFLGNNEKLTSVTYTELMRLRSQTADLGSDCTLRKTEQKKGLQGTGQWPRQQDEAEEGVGTPLTGVSDTQLPAKPDPHSVLNTVRMPAGQRRSSKGLHTNPC